MRFLADENFPGASVRALEDAECDIAWVARLASGMADPDVLQWAAREKRILLTFDKDFGELARMFPLPGACGVLLFRMPMPKPSGIGQMLSALVMSRDDWAGHFSVIEPGRIRMRPLAPMSAP